jgi:hypothetical protein
MHRRSGRRFTALALIAVAASAVSACSWFAPTPSASPTRAPVTSSVDFFYVMNQPTEFTLIDEPRDFTWNDDLLTEALAGLIDGSVQAADPDYVNFWGNGSMLNSVELEGETLRLDLTLGTLSVGAESETRAIEQIVWTATGIDPTLTGVAFTVDGVTVNSIGGHVDATGVFTREAPESVLNSVQILYPAQGETVGGPLTFSGVACVFEANVSWELTRGGMSVRSGSALAAESCPARAPWMVELGELPPGDYRFTVAEFSANDGSIAALDDKDFTVAAS